MQFTMMYDNNAAHHGHYPKLMSENAQFQTDFSTTQNRFSKIVLFFPETMIHWQLNLLKKILMFIINFSHILRFENRLRSSVIKKRPNGHSDIFRNNLPVCIVYAHASCNFQCITCPYSNANLHLLFKQILHYNWGSFFFSLGLMVTKPIQCSGASGHFREIREIFLQEILYSTSWVALL